MREFFFILFAICILIALTVLRYRKGILAVIRVSRMVKQASFQGNERGVQRVNSGERSPLIKCSRCGTWVPEGRSRKIGAGSYFCSIECIESKVR